jgi:hypothetical protein
MTHVLQVLFLSVFILQVIYTNTVVFQYIAHFSGNQSLLRH